MSHSELGKGSQSVSPDTCLVKDGFPGCRVFLSKQFIYCGRVGFSVWQCVKTERFQWFCNLLRYTRIARFDRDGDVLMGIGGAHERGQMSRVAEQAEITGGFLYTNVTNTSAQSATAGAGAVAAASKGAQKLVANPIKICGAQNAKATAAVIIAPPAPLLAEHTEEIMMEAVERDEYLALVAAGAFGAHPSPRSKL